MLIGRGTHDTDKGSRHYAYFCSMKTPSFQPEQVIYEDNHVLVVNKLSGQLTQGDFTGDIPLPDALKAFIKQRDNKPGNVFMGVVHRLDRPVSGVVLFAKTDKALTRMNAAFAGRDVKKIYWALSAHSPKPVKGQLVHWLKKDPKARITHAITRAAKDYLESSLDYRLLKSGELNLIEVQPHTGRPHQIRAQLSALGCPIWGDLKYGAPKGFGSAIALHARALEFTHPTRDELIRVEAPLPRTHFWDDFRGI